MWSSAIAWALLVLAPAGVAAGLGYQRADGRWVELAVVEHAGRLVIAVPGRARPIELSDRLIVVPWSPRELPDAWLADQGLRRVRRWSGIEPVWLLRAADPVAAVRACAALSDSGRVRWAVPDFQIPVEMLHTPTDPLYPEQWHLFDPGGQDIAVEGAWDLTLGDPQVVVAVIDTGVDPAHPDLDPARMIPGHNAIDGSDNAAPSELAIDHHGTACMGLAAADLDNGEGVAGVCPGCGWMPVRVFDRGALMSLSALSEGISWAVDHGAWVLSNSWGVGQELIDQGVDVAPIQSAVRYAVEVGRAGKGCVVLFAAGNGDFELNAQPIGPDELPAMPETLAVGGCDHLGAVARYSDYGPMISVLAPTWGGYPDEPRITTTDSSAAAGVNKAGENHRTDPELGDIPTGSPEPDAAGHYTRYFGGTSAATPIVAGTAALVLSVAPGLSWQEVFELLQSTAEKIGLDAQPPRVAARYDLDGHDERYGHGRVHAERAVAVALYGRDQPDGQPCRLDLNCQHACLAEVDPLDEPRCARPCLSRDDCGPEWVCLAGACRLDVPTDPQPGPDDVLGGCGCASWNLQAGLWDGWLGLAWLALMAGGPSMRTRRSRRTYLLVFVGCLGLVLGCEQEREVPVGQMEPLGPSAGVARPDPVPSPAQPAPEPEPLSLPDEAGEPAPALPPPEGSVLLRWKLPEEHKLAFSAWMGKLPAQADLGPALKAEALIAAGQLPKPLAARLASLPASPKASLTAILAPSFGGSLTVRMISNDFQIPPELDPDMAQRLVAVGAGTELRGEISERGKAISAGASEEYQLLGLLFELPEQHVVEGDSWSLEVELLAPERGLESQQKEKLNRVVLQKIKKPAPGRQLAVLQYLVAERETGLDQSGAGDPKPYVRSAVFVGQGEFAVEDGRWTRFVGRLLRIDPRERTSIELKGYSLVALPKLPAKFKDIE